MKVSQDVPKYMMVAGERAELRGLNVIGLTRRGFSTAEVYVKHKLLKLVVFNFLSLLLSHFALVIIQIRSLKAAYRKIFMCADANAGSFEGRLAEVVSCCVPLLI